MSLFNEFESVSYNQWLEKIISDLKGKDFNENLVWNTDEGFPVQPIYHSEQLVNNKSASYNLFNQSNIWEIREQITLSTPKEANQKALMALKGGANRSTPLCFLSRMPCPEMISILGVNS